MAPVGMVGVVDWVSSPEVGIISLVAFLVLSITLLALCAKCKRSTNAYDVSGTMTDGAGQSNGTSGAKSGENTDQVDVGSLAWRDHKGMPPNTLVRTKTMTN